MTDKSPIMPTTLFLLQTYLKSQIASDKPRHVVDGNIVQFGRRFGSKIMLGVKSRKEYVDMAMVRSQDRKASEFVADFFIACFGYKHVDFDQTKLVTTVKDADFELFQRVSGLKSTQEALYQEKCQLLVNSIFEGGRSALDFNIQFKIAKQPDHWLFTFYLG